MQIFFSRYLCFNFTLKNRRVLLWNIIGSIFYSHYGIQYIWEGVHCKRKYIPILKENEKWVLVYVETNHLSPTKTHVPPPPHIKWLIGLPYDGYPFVCYSKSGCSLEQLLPPYSYCIFIKINAGPHICHEEYW